VREAAVGRGQRVAERRYEPRRGGAGGGHRHLLAEHGAHRELGAVDCPGQAQPGGGAHERREQRVAGEVLRRQRGVGVEVEQAPAAPDRRGQVAHVGEPQAAHDVTAGRPGGRQLDDAVTVRQAQRAPVAISHDLLHTGHGAGAEEVEQPTPVQRRAIGQAQGERAGLGGDGAGGARGGGDQRRLESCIAPWGGIRRRGRAAAQRGGGAPVDGTDRIVELAHAREPGGVRHVDLTQRGGLDQDPCRLRALGAGQRQRTRAQLGRQLAREVSLAVREASRQAAHAFAIDRSVGDQVHRARRQVAAQVPLRRAGGGVGMAAQAGAKAVALCGRRGWIEADVAALGDDRRTARATVDPGGRDGDEEAAVETAVAAAEHAVTGLELALAGRPPRFADGGCEAHRWQYGPIMLAVFGHRVVRFPPGFWVWAFGGT
jgi:hypothetical protein